MNLAVGRRAIDSAFVHRTEKRDPGCSSGRPYHQMGLAAGHTAIGSALVHRTDRKGPVRAFEGLVDHPSLMDLAVHHIEKHLDDHRIGRRFAVLRTGRKDFAGLLPVHRIEAPVAVGHKPVVRRIETWSLKVGTEEQDDAPGNSSK